jgi:hypothetical protein
MIGNTIVGETASDPLLPWALRVWPPAVLRIKSNYHHTSTDFWEFCQGLTFFLRWFDGKYGLGVGVDVRPTPEQLDLPIPAFCEGLEHSANVFKSTLLQWLCLFNWPWRWLARISPGRRSRKHLLLRPRRDILRVRKAVERARVLGQDLQRPRLQPAALHRLGTNPHKILSTVGLHTNVLGHWLFRIYV